MLILTREEGQSATVKLPDGRLAVVRIAGVRCGRVRIAFEFPRDIQIDRTEIYEEKQRALAQKKVM